MKKIIIVSLTLLAVVASCKRTKIECPVYNNNMDMVSYPQIEPCESSLCEKYMTIWKELFLEKNNMSTDYFNRHIKVLQSGLTKTDAQFPIKSFVINFQQSVDWASSNVFEICFPVILTQKDPGHPGVAVPLNSYLEKEHIKVLIDSNAFASHITKVNPIEKLFIKSPADAIDKMEHNAKVTRFCYFGTFISLATGNLNYRATAGICPDLYIDSNIDLVSGKVESSRGPCPYD